MKPLFVGYIGVYDDDMTPVAMASERDDCLSKTLHATAQLGCLRVSQMVIQSKGEISDDSLAEIETAFALAMEKTLKKNTSQVDQAKFGSKANSALVKLMNQLTPPDGEVEEL